MAGFFRSVADCYVYKILNYKDRATRSEFWSFMFFNVLVGILFYLLFLLLEYMKHRHWELLDIKRDLFWSALGGNSTYSTFRPGFFDSILLNSWVPDAVDGIMAFGLLQIIILAVWSFIAFLTVNIRRLHDIDRPAWLIVLYLVPFGALVIFCLYACRGTEGPNRSGPDPLDTQDPLNAFK